MNMQTILKLGRVSNLPTVWTNAIAGAVLAGMAPMSTVLIVALALSLFYIGGMWLNDAFDAEIDARERANRPIPMGEITARTVFIVGFALMTLAILITLPLGTSAVWTGLALAGSVILYDWLHKRTVFSPVIMGATRFFCYILAAAAIGEFTGTVIFGALGLLAYIVGLTYAAKQEAYDRLDRAWPLAVLAIPVIYGLTQAIGNALAMGIWAGFVVVLALALRLLFRRNKGDVPKAVVTMIAGICLYDATLIAGTGEVWLAIIAICGFGLTILLQRAVSGT